MKSFILICIVLTALQTRADEAVLYRMPPPEEWMINWLKKAKTPIFQEGTRGGDCDHELDCTSTTRVEYISSLTGVYNDCAEYYIREGDPKLEKTEKIAGIAALTLGILTAAYSKAHNPELKGLLIGSAVAGGILVGTKPIHSSLRQFKVEQAIQYATYFFKYSGTPSKIKLEWSKFAQEVIRAVPEANYESIQNFILEVTWSKEACQPSRLTGDEFLALIIEKHRKILVQ